MQLHGTLGTHDHRSDSNSQRISLSFVTIDETREERMIKLSQRVQAELFNHGRLGVSVTGMPRQVGHCYRCHKASKLDSVREAGRADLPGQWVSRLSVGGET